MKQLLASDFDGTIYFKGNFKEEDLKAISEFQKQGHLFGLCSGRPLRGLMPFIPESLHLDFYICCSGGCIYDGNRNEIIKHTIPKATLGKAMDQFSNLEIFVMGEKGLYTYGSRGTYEEDLITHIKNVDDIGDDVILGFSFSIQDDILRNEVKEKLETYASIDCFQNVFALDCVPKGCSKQTGLHTIQDYFDLNHHQIACIGDSYNDLPMFNYASRSFTFYSSEDDVRQKATDIVNHTHEAIALLMKDA